MSEGSSVVKIGITIEAEAQSLVKFFGSNAIGYLFNGDFQGDMNTLVENSTKTVSLLTDLNAQEKIMAGSLADLDTQQAAEVTELNNLNDNIGTLTTLFNTLAAAAASPTPVDVTKEVEQGAAILNGLQLANSTIASALAAQAAPPAPHVSDGASTDTTAAAAAPVIPPVPDGPAAPDPSIAAGGGVTVAPAGDPGSAPAIIGTGAAAVPDASTAANTGVGAGAGGGLTI